VDEEFVVGGAVKSAVFGVESGGGVGFADPKCGGHF